MDNENLNYLPQYQKLIFDNKENLVDVNRKCLIQTYSASLQLLDNNETLQLLEVNLEKYTKSLNNAFKEKLKVDGAVPMTKHSYLKPVNLKFPNCNQHCSGSDFNELMKHLKVKEVKPKKQILPQAVVKSTSFSLTPPEDIKESKPAFRTAREELEMQNSKANNNRAPACGQKRKLGTLGARRNVQSKFVSPVLAQHESNEHRSHKSNEWPGEEEFVDERLKNIDPKMVELIRSEIMDNAPVVQWDEIAGLESAKNAIHEAVVWPMLRPDIFTGLRKPPKGILLFGPPGTGKTLIGKCVASQSKSTFFSISASSLTSKWIGDGEKMVRALFSVALCHQPAVIFIDEIDSLLSQRSETEHESTRRLKTEFLVRLDGATTCNDERVLVIGATNRPQELDEAARRRFVKRLYIPLPEYQARLQIVTNLMSKERHSLAECDMSKVAELTDGYSGADMRNLCSEASLGPIRSIDIRQMEFIEANEVRPVEMKDFSKALSTVRSSVSPNDLTQYVEWNKVYGSGCLI
ncbi:hypothetical protein PPYR_04676 [Photinus pyralis]|uniref:Fidgetin-like protein 1 n=1 Tax=Photinus pyralis TaxID=7054 RepID=A0A5N4AZA9_PHOPY|nr:fidgetin-like protein 1 [Photinus pyralis]KAB0802490.1 hypothetical protein PPYR_04676 [Photinus pyralis]